MLLFWGRFNDKKVVSEFLLSLPFLMFSAELLKV